MNRPLLVTALVALPAGASAHVELVSPPQRYPAADPYDIPLKDGPCGRADNAPGMVGRSTFAPGETITVKWNEFVPHSGHFRIAFDPDGDDDLGSPTDYDDLYTAGVLVLEDGIPHVNGQSAYSLEVTLPDQECDNCTLQLIQVMTDKMPWGPAGGDDLYFQCADIELQAGGGTSGSGGETGTTGPGTSSSTSSSTGTTGPGTTGGDASSAGATGAGPSTGGSGSDTDGDSQGSGTGSGSGCRVDARGNSGLLALLLLALGGRRSQRRWRRSPPCATVRP